MALALAESMDHIGPMTRSVDDASIMLGLFLDQIKDQLLYVNRFPEC